MYEDATKGEKDAAARLDWLLLRASGPRCVKTQCSASGPATRAIIGRPERRQTLLKASTTPSMESTTTTPATLHRILQSPIRATTNAYILGQSHLLHGNLV